MRHPLPNLARASFSLLYTDTDQATRSLDLTCRSQQEFELWYWGLHVSLQCCKSTNADSSLLQYVTHA